MKNTNNLRLWPSPLALIVFVLYIGLISSEAKAQGYGQLDNTFGTNGKVSTMVQPAGWWSVVPAALQTDGKILQVLTIVRSQNRPIIVIARYLTDGSLDNTWGDNGISTVDIPNSMTARIYDIKTLADGKVLVSGVRDTLLGGLLITSQYMLKYLSNGSIDTSFGNGGAVTIGAQNETARIQTTIVVDNQIITFSTINSQLEFKAFNINTGRIDSTWGINGLVLHPIQNTHSVLRNVLVDEDGKMLLIWGGLVCRYLANGQIDSSFAVNGMFEPIHARDGIVNFLPRYMGKGAGITLAFQDNKILVSGIAWPYSPLVGNAIVERYDANGHLDSSFADSGVLAVDFRNSDYGINQINDVVVAPDGSIIVTGNAEDTISGRIAFALRGYTAEGGIDSTFGIDGMNIVSFHQTDSLDYCYKALMQPDGKVILAGLSPLFDSATNGIPLNSFSLARFNKRLISATENYTAASAFKVELLPNPTIGQCLIRSTTAMDKISIYNAQGQLLTAINTKSEPLQMQLDLADYSAGIYFISIHSVNGQQVIQKLVKE